MGAFSKVLTHTVPTSPEQGKEWGWEPHESVTLKQYALYGDVQRSADPNGINGMDMTKMLYYMITSWTFTDDNHNPVPVSLQAIELLPTPYFSRIIGAMAESVDVTLPNLQTSVISANVPS